MAEPVKELDYGGVTLAHYPVGCDREGRALAIRHVLEDRRELWRFSHECLSPRSGIVLRIAPALMIGQGHEVLSTDPLHIEASILCSDCGIHGWVRGGRWVDA